MRKLILVAIFIILLAYAKADCYFPYSEEKDFCLPYYKGVFTVTTSDNYRLFYEWRGYAYYSYVTLSFPKTNYIAFQVWNPPSSPGNSIRVSSSYFSSFDIGVASGERKIVIVNTGSCTSDICSITITGLGGGSSSNAVLFEGAYWLRSDKFIPSFFQNSYYNYLQFYESNDPFIVARYYGDMQHVNVTYANGIATYTVDRFATIPATGGFSLMQKFSEAPDSLWWFAPGTIGGGFSRGLEFGYDAYDFTYIYYPDVTKRDTLSIVRWKNLEQYKKVDIPVTSANSLTRFNSFWIDRKHKIVAVADASSPSSLYMLLERIQLIDMDFVQDRIKYARFDIYGISTSALYYQTYLNKYDIAGLSVDAYIPLQFYDLTGSYSLVSSNYNKFIGEKLSFINNTIYSLRIQGIDLNGRRAYIYDGTQFLASGIVSNNAVLFDRAVTLDPMKEYYILFEWNASSYPSFTSNDLNDKTKFVYCSSETSCVSMNYDFPMKINHYLPVNTMIEYKARIYGGIPPYRVCLNATRDTTPLQTCMDTSDTDVTILYDYVPTPQNLIYNVNVTDSKGYTVYSDFVTASYFSPVYAINDVIVNYEGIDYHHNQIITIETDSNTLMGGKKFLFDVRQIIGGTPPFNSTLVCGKYNVTKPVPGIITLGIETSGDLSLSYSDFIRLASISSYNSTHDKAWIGCAFSTYSYAMPYLPLDGPIVNFYVYIPKAVPFTIRLSIDKTRVTVNESVKVSVALSGTPPYLAQLDEEIYHLTLCKWKGYSANMTLYFSFPCSYSYCERTYYLIARATDSAGATAVSNIVEIVVNTTYNPKLPDTIFIPDCPGITVNATPTVPYVPPPVVVPTTLPSTAPIINVTEMAEKYNITGPALTSLYLVSTLVTPTGISLLISIAIATVIAYLFRGTPNAVLIWLGAFLGMLILFAVGGYFPSWILLILIVITGLGVAYFFKGVIS